MLHELRVYRIGKGKSVDDLLRFFHRDGKRDYHAALREAGIGVAGAWRNAASPEELVWIRAFASAAHKEEACARLYASSLWMDELEGEADRLIADLTTMDLVPRDTTELVRGPRDRGFHELRHYRLAPGTTPRMLAFFEDVRRVMPEVGVRVLAWWTAEHEGSERFLWLREFRDAAHKAQVMKDLYESERWLRDFKPRTVGLIEERFLTDLIPVPAAALGGHDPLR